MNYVCSAWLAPDEPDAGGLVAYAWDGARAERLGQYWSAAGAAGLPCEPPLVVRLHAPPTPAGEALEPVYAEIFLDPERGPVGEAAEGAWAQWVASSPDLFVSARWGGSVGDELTWARNLVVPAGGGRFWVTDERLQSLGVFGPERRRLAQPLTRSVRTRMRIVAGRVAPENCELALERRAPVMHSIRAGVTRLSTSATLVLTARPHVWARAARELGPVLEHDGPLARDPPRSPLDSARAQTWIYNPAPGEDALLADWVDAVCAARPGTGRSLDLAARAVLAEMSDRPSTPLPLLALEYALLVVDVATVEPQRARQFDARRRTLFVEAPPGGEVAPHLWRHALACLSEQPFSPLMVGALKRRAHMTLAGERVRVYMVAERAEDLVRAQVALAAGEPWERVSAGLLHEGSARLAAARLEFPRAKLVFPAPDARGASEGLLPEAAAGGQYVVLAPTRRTARRLRPLLGVGAEIVLMCSRELPDFLHACGVA